MAQSLRDSGVKGFLSLILVFPIATDLATLLNILLLRHFLGFTAKYQRRFDGRNLIYANGGSEVWR